jgi:hypothetical protein
LVLSSLLSLPLLSPLCCRHASTAAAAQPPMLWHNAAGLVGQSGGRSVSWSVGLLVGWSVFLLVGLLVSWLVGQLVGQSASQLVV